MPKAHNPRHGSMQYWPRKRAKKPTPRVRSTAKSKEVKVLGFAGYKVGMTHVSYIDEGKASFTKNEEIACAATVIECPPVLVYGIRFYASDKVEGIKVVYEQAVHIENKDLKRKLMPTKKKGAELEKVPEFDFLRLIVFTQPRLAGFGKKKPDIFEVDVGGNKEEQLAFAKDVLGKEVKITDVFSDNHLVDIFAISKGKGFQGPVKRFGVKIQRPKKEKIKRGPGARSGGWTSQGHMMFRVATPGQMGYHQRVEYNKQILKISDNPEEVNPKGGFINYGLIKSTYLLLKGSVIGPKKRMIRLNPSSRALKKPAPISVNYISIESKQKK